MTDGDYFGIYSTDGTNPALVPPPATGVNITLEIEGESTTPTPPVTPNPPNTGTGGSIGGTVFVPTGGTVAGAGAVYACYPTGDDAVPCDETLSGIVEVQLASSSSTYSVDNLQTGQYIVLALADADGNGSFADATDYIGFYPSVDTPELVSPPTTGIDIQMVTSGEAGLASVPHTLSAAEAFIGKTLFKNKLERAFDTLN